MNKVETFPRTSLPKFVCPKRVHCYISLKKAAEIMEIEAATVLKILDLMGIEFSNLSAENVALEKNC